MNLQKLSPLRIRPLSVDQPNSLEQYDRIQQPMDVPTYES